MSLTPGLYELLVTEGLAGRLPEDGANVVSLLSKLRPAEAADRIALHLSRFVARLIESIPEPERAQTGVAIARAFIERLSAEYPNLRLGTDSPSETGEVLRAILARRPDGQPASLVEPLIPLLDTALLTNSPGEPRIGSQVLAEIDSADQIDLIMAFVRRSGIRPLLDALRMHCERGRSLRVLTTTYTGSTEAEALELLNQLGAQVRVSYDVSNTRLHAKAWVFHRDSGFSTAYIGSSNLTHSAQVSGLEWNVRVSGARNDAVVQKMAAVFEAYWNSGDFLAFDPIQFRAVARAERQAQVPTLSPIEIRLEPFQERLLEQIDLSRLQGNNANLLVSATGTGKTVMAAVDYVRLAAKLPRSRLLFVAHRMEILEQSRATFRHALRDPGFGELWVGGERPESFEHVFASIQSLNSSSLHHLDASHYDIVVVDEFHHAAAESYAALLSHIRPRQLLGLTATPERSDGLPILEWFGGRIAAELRLWDAIDQQRLVPFSYYGIHDGVDLTEIPWRRGRGYDVDGLTNLYTANDIWARQILQQLLRRVDNVSEIRALGFCVSVQHAEFMARVFAGAGVHCRAVSATTSETDRRAALRDLAARRINVLFSVDLFNEGIDLPAVDTLLMLRPTESPTLFMQQLGRGLRRMEGKTSCTVLDFIGVHRAEFRFDRRFRALLGGTRREVEEQIEAGFPFLPSGCHLQLDRKSSEVVLNSIRNALPATWNAKVAELASLRRGGRDISLDVFLEESGLDLEDVYASGRGWSELQEAAGVATSTKGPAEQALRRACGRVLHTDDLRRIDAYRTFLELVEPPSVSGFGITEQRLLRMLVGPMLPRGEAAGSSLQDAVGFLWQHAGIRRELLELLGVLRKRLSHVPYELEQRPSVPLTIHARYSRLEVLAAFGVGASARPPTWQTGVYWVPEERSDLFAFTLDKTSGQFSPTTRYRDYAISPTLIHWESQAMTRADGETGRRYQHHVALGSSIQLFARLKVDEPFFFLGPATYVEHKSERPMAITWRLEVPLPGDLFARFAAAVA